MTNLDRMTAAQCGGWPPRLATAVNPRACFAAGGFTPLNPIGQYLPAGGKDLCIEGVGVMASDKLEDLAERMIVLSHAAKDIGLDRVNLHRGSWHFSARLSRSLVDLAMHYSARPRTAQRVEPALRLRAPGRRRQPSG
jgi:hypothetical protein